MSDILSAICPLLVEQTIKSYKKRKILQSRNLALLHGFREVSVDWNKSSKTFKSCHSDQFGGSRTAWLSHSRVLFLPENRICTLFVLYFENYAPNLRALEIASETLALDVSK